jgi:acyl-CoA thioesterase-1
MVIALRALAVAAVLCLASPVTAATLNIVAIGASNTTGFGVGEDHAYPALLQALLRKKGINASVTNAGVNGDVTSGMLRRIDGAVPKGTDLVILQPPHPRHRLRSEPGAAGFLSMGSHPF